MMLLTSAQAEALTGNRVESWRYELLTWSEAPTGSLDGVTGASFDFSNAATIRSGGTLSYQGKERVDWMRVRVQPWYTVRSGDVELSWPIGVFIPASPGTGYNEHGATQEVELYDKLLILDQDKVESVWSYPVGTVVTEAITALILSTGESHISIDASEETLSTAMVWEAGTTKLRIVNDLLSAINYFSLWADGRGYYRASKYLDPSSRGVVWSFEDGARSIYSPNFTHDEDAFNVPNKVILIGQSDGENEALVSTAYNQDPASPYSFENRGRWIALVETGVEATSQQVLDELAQRRLVDLSQVGSTLELRHAHIPLELNDAVRFKRQNGLEADGVVQKYTISTAVGALVSTTIREVTA